ncbi:MAG: ribosome biogenesis GTPase YlqF [Lachnospiraceae bacterium]|nr:ribosome biogenesis GTPase YlqF [Lachnospiraceae bacterium]
MEIQWYPGHMTKAVRQMQEDMKLIDLVIELVDARAPQASRNPDIDKLANGKARLMILNKCDLADPAVTRAWKSYYESQGLHVAMIDARERKNVRSVDPIVEEACKAKRERDARRGIKNRPIRAMVAGIPNIGKSTFINSYSGKASAKTGNKPGVTKGKQWIRLSKSLELLDTPGILWPKFEDPQVGILLASIGSVRDEILGLEELSMELITLLIQRYPGILSEKYQVDESKQPAEILGEIATFKNCIKSGGELDYERCAKLFLDDFRSGKLGARSLQSPQS